MPVGEFVAGRVLVKFQPATAAPDALARLGLRTTGHIAALDVHEVGGRARSRDGDDCAVAGPGGRPVCRAGYAVHALDTVPDDPSYVLQWGLARIRAPQAWDILNTTGGANTLLAIVDTGIDLTHPDFACAWQAEAGL